MLGPLPPRPQPASLDAGPHIHASILLVFLVSRSLGLMARRTQAGVLVSRSDEGASSSTTVPASSGSSYQPNPILSGGTLGDERFPVAEMSSCAGL
ncbi:hypothetical protein ZIOFF_006243 [Zingiber officinale]|uniref:Uncharacterized protein n=1 Tax=Zingiber officinale TaxID=94328 RepID=A0A8J5HRX7_ZINOF|nr:hypothetical protein ZIOFF_006243 [Zingiber officinale]